MKQLIQFIALSGLTIQFTTVVAAAVITGSLDISGEIMINSSSMASASQVTSSKSCSTSMPSGTFTSLANGTSVTFTPVWIFNSSKPVTNFWSAGGFKFESTSAIIVSQGSGGNSGFVIIDGTGVVSGNGYTPTACNWSFTSQDPQVGGNYWVFSMSITSKGTNGTPVMGMRKAASGLVLSWNDSSYTLQAAPTLNGTFTNVPGATSPYTNHVVSSALFFRLNQ